MKLHLSLLAVPVLLLAQTTSAEVIYGEDNRVEVYQATKSQQIKARSAATMIPKSKISRTSRSEIVEINQESLRQSLELTPGAVMPQTLFSLLIGKKPKKATFCKNEQFVDQPNAGACSGFLIAPDLLVTAGHCAAIENVCNDYQWVFDFKIDEKTKTAGKNLDSKNIYSCKKIITSALINGLKVDFGIIQLDRSVDDRTPLKVRTSGKIKKNDPLFVIGSPSGLPLKVAGNGNVREASHPLKFTSNLDTFAGNSGSAVFNDKTGIVEGILVRGDDDYIPNSSKTCIEAKRCTEDGCAGEVVTKISTLPEIGVYETLAEAIESGDLELVKTVFKLNIWVDFSLADGQTALIKAAKANQVEIANFLISIGANKTHKDASGKSALDHAYDNNAVEVIGVLSAN